MKPRVVIYMPFYSGCLESRHARMHDLIHFLNGRNDLEFDYKVFAERGKDRDSKRIHYLSVPLVTSHPRRFENLRPGKRSSGKGVDFRDVSRMMFVFMLVVRCMLERSVDVLHIVRPNRVSSLVERILRNKNPHLRVIVGPNIMSYGELSETYEPNYFRQDHIETVIAVGSYHCELLKRFGVPESKLVRLPPNVDPSVFYPKQNGSKDERNGRMRILFAASQLAVEKGTHTFLEAIRLFKEEDVDFTAIIAGSEEVISGVQTPFDRSLLSGLEEDIQLLGRVSRDRMAELYRQADVFVHAGQAEAGPTTTIESLRCGTPCILPDHPSFKEPELMPGCLFFPMGDSRALKDCLVRFYHGWLGGEQQQVSLPAIEPNVAKEFVTRVYLGTLCPPRDPS